MKKKLENNLYAYERPTLEIISLVGDVIRTSGDSGDELLPEPDFPSMAMDFEG